MGWVVHSDCHHADEPEGPDANRTAAVDGQDSTARDLSGLHRPTLYIIHGRYVGRDHGADRTGHCCVLRGRFEARAAVNLLDVDTSSKRHIARVDQVLTQRRNVEAATVPSQDLRSAARRSQPASA